MKINRRSRIRLFSIAASLLILFSLLTPVIGNAKTNNRAYRSVKSSQSLAKAKLSDRLLEDFKENEKITFLIKFKEKANTKKIAKDARKSAASANLTAQKLELIQRSAVVSELKATSLKSQKSVKQFLENEVEKGNAGDIRSYYIVNGIAVTSTKEVAQKVASFEEVEKVLPNETRQLYATKTKETKSPQAEVDNVEWNVNHIGAPHVWEMGIDGTGTVIASIDTGVQWEHPALKRKYRGYDQATGEVNHDFSWFDATAGETEPYDEIGHGTHTIGTMVGGEPDGSNQIGVAPGAKFIAVKAFTADGGTDADLLAAAEWVLAPTDLEGNTRVDLAPDIVNNSWGGGPGLDEWYRDVVKNWRAANIFPEFSAGNTTRVNPGGPRSIANPANYPESFAAGATDINDGLAEFSLRGPSPYEEIKPDISAPGVNIRSSVPGGGYEGGWNGTSMAAPAISGVVALLHQVDASLTVNELEEILVSTAIPMTNEEYNEAPNNGYGYGLVNAHAAVSSIITGLGTLKGQVTKHGEDTEEPAFEHNAATLTYAGLDLDLSIHVTDNISVSSVILMYQVEDGDWQTAEALRASGDYKSGEYAVTIPGEQIKGSSLKYKWMLTDFGDNEVITDGYVVQVKEGISIGYSEDFEATPIGWTSFGENNNWEWGVPTTGPEGAVSGEKVYATNLDGDYETDENATLVMPPVILPEEGAFLQFQKWHELESYQSGNFYDFAHVFISTDQEEWTQVLEMKGTTTDWEQAEVDLSDYSGQKIYIGFNLTSDSTVTKQGLYIDDVAISDTSIAGEGTIGKIKGKQGKENHISSGINRGYLEINGKKKINPDTIRPKRPEITEPSVQENGINPTLLPMQAQVSVLESGRTVMTDPANGTYSLSHAAGEFTVQASTYGYQSQQQTVTIEKDGIGQADFTLTELPQATIHGTITDEETGQLIEGATLFLVEDANISPVKSDENGNYSLTAYEGTYTLKILARNYDSKEMEIRIDSDQELNIELEPFYTYPGGEIGYDDGTAENAHSFYEAGNGWAVKMSLPTGKDSAIVTEGIFRFWDLEWPVPGGKEFAVEVWDASGTDGQPGKKIAGPFDAEALRNGDWTVVDLKKYAITVNSDFYMVYIQTAPDPNAPGLATDENGFNAERSYRYIDGSWSRTPENEGNTMIRARVSYQVDVPVITSPADDLTTTNSNILIEGTSSPTTTVQLVNNGESAGTADVGGNGKFTIPIELSEGENMLKAVSLLDEAQTGESAPVTVTLDTEKPKLMINSPRDGDKINRETVTVEGTVSDANLDYVKVNDRKANVSGGSYSKRILLDKGENKIEVVARDLAGNAESKSVAINVKFNKPVVENVTPTEDKNLKTGQSVKIEFDSEPGLRGTFFVHMPLTDMGLQIANATELPMMEQSDGHYVGYWTVPSGVKADGAVIEVKAVDSFHNETRKIAKGKLFINLGE
ncbi:peptidase S8 [Virgibacillus phasianinus]|uniref:Peptidase S8 n=1 Tax=Virgibacillus phasianinus TaxID=2017483 RepID=A0A220U496_9BACI|nr:S8 family peptidase [Virgibacillus phasianinus]ASK62885.1 peptidase S8 [Virgibacillus phasianinus]